MADNIEKLIFKDNYLSKEEKSKASFWLSNLKEADKNNIVSIISAIKKDDSALYVIGSSLNGQNYASIDFFIFDPEIKNFAGNHFLAENINELNNDLARYAISRFSREFGKKAIVEDNRYDCQKFARIELNPKNGSLINLFLPIIYNELKNSYQFYPDYKSFENEVGRKISSFPMITLFRKSK